MLIEFEECLTSTAPYCRGDLTFHSTDRLIPLLRDRICRRKGDWQPSRESGNMEDDVGRPPSGTLSPLPSCRYYGSFKFRHCGLFGDPHLRTFDRQYQTCRINGTWKLIENPYLSVEVTNRPVVQGSLATAPTKVRTLVTLYCL